jgi:plastocyanin
VRRDGRRVVGDVFAPKGRSQLRLHLRHLPSIGLLCGVALALLPSLASSATTASVEALNEGAPPYGETHRWSPAQVAVTTNGGRVTFANNSATVPHGIVWKSGPATPVCEEGAGKVPVGVGNSGHNWSGACTFTQEGTYSYYCSVHGLAMSGTAYVNAAGALPPTATTEVATAITETGATLKGAIDPNGQPTSYYFNYGTTASYGLKTNELSVGSDSANHMLSAAVTGLSAGATYHFQIVATYASGASTVLGSDRTFVTASPPGAPIASTTAATAIGETTVTLNGQVNPSGTATTYVFNYGTTSSYGHTTAVASAGEGATSREVSATVTGLAPGATYHFQILAHNSLGDAPGVDETFTTVSPPPPPPPTTTTTTTTTTPPPTGTTTTTTTTSVTSTPPPGSAASLGATTGSPLVGSAASAIRINSAQHGASVHGSLDISPAGAGGRLKVDILAASASLARKQHAKQLRIGRLLRASLAAGRLSFSVSLNAQAKRALHRHHRLPVIVQITLSPLHGAPITATRSVTLRG